MAKVLTLSRTFPPYHPKAGQPTYFVEQVLNALRIKTDETYLDKLFTWNKDKIDSGVLTNNDLIEFNNSLDSDILGLKPHTIRAKTVNKKTGLVSSRWKAGDKASLRVWSGRPYFDPQIIIAADVELVKVGDFVIKECERYDDVLEMSIPEIWIDIGTKYNYPHTCSMDMSIIPEVAKNDGLSTNDLLDWFRYPKAFEGQILCWKEVHYG